MSTETGKSPLPGSDRQIMPDAHVVGAVEPNERIEVTVVVRPRPSQSLAARADELGARLPGERKN
ncbi:MAG TPA: hypothetical protein VMT34_02300, partial [Aggregatilineales bacterium]|nr:hypothetical protein [Aggregatilineales bacterium]